ncbi:Ger(x)C family spore germination protein [Caproiciproducens faecalis]|uniref:Ger(X)C family spore germination protein n=1 Tax=Caproiciproducens faecalis TaxID=2820301 RepID=A0ABS7DJK8_9FIRM|nr:Ger(x)C family spore germination protein [Caproiciproducens faecalis]MBW7571403.1 Ger(x)C family spore germination protein [Caproiciproducens faecalis]
MKTGKRLCVLLLIVSMFFLNGCWNYREIETLAMVSGFAIDKGTDGHKYHLTFEFLDLTSENMGSKLLETDGDTVFDAVRNAISKSQKKLMFSDCKIILISKELASEGIAPLLDFVTRDTEPRITLHPMISEEKTAGEILQQKPLTDHLICLELNQILDQNTANLAEAPKIRLYQANNLLEGQGSSLFLPSIKIAKQKAASTLELAGTAVFKQDKLVGFLDRNQSKDLLFIKNQIKGGLLLVSPDASGQKITLEIKESKTEIKPVFVNQLVTIQINIKTACALAEDETSKSYDTLEGLKKVEERANKMLESDITGTIQTVQTKYDSDIFGFGSLVYQSDPQYWEKEKPKWGELFPTLKVSVTADVKILNTAVAKSTIKAGE